MRNHIQDALSGTYYVRCRGIEELEEDPTRDAQGIPKHFTVKGRPIARVLALSTNKFCAGTIFFSS
jgi:hypothetical protein